MTTLLHLLWVDLSRFPHGNGPILPAESPVIGLPYRVAGCALLEALSRQPPSHLPASPYIWSFTADAWQSLVVGRRAQLGIKNHGALGQQLKALLETRLSQKWPLPLHSAYGITHTGAILPPPDFSQTWASALQFLTAIDGSEQILDRIAENSPSAIPFSERWHLRSRIPLPSELWDWLETISRIARTSSFSNSGWRNSTRQIVRFLRRHFKTHPLILPDEFIAERVDVSLAEASSPEFPCAIERRVSLPVVRPPVIGPPLNPNEKVSVRIAQATAEPEWTDYACRFPRLLRCETQRIMRQVIQAFASSSSEGRNWEAAVFPEVLLPPDEHRRFERLVAQTGRAGLIGCLWREIPTAVKQLVPSATATRYVVNEALLAVPLPSLERRTPRVRSFLVRKPLPAHVEEAFVQRLSELAGRPGAWQMLSGRRIYRFVHPRWGDFTVAICSDLLDPVPWASLKGQILHLFMCSYNQDVNLFEALTWVRAYENCINVVATNCGHHGGSFAWSPQSGEDKELARLRGTRLQVIADVQLPVRALLNWQLHGVDETVSAELARWRRDTSRQGQPFKAPPPGFHRP